jgi:hypothetical protein
MVFSKFWCFHFVVLETIADSALAMCHGGVILGILPDIFGGLSSGKQLRLLRLSTVLDKEQKINSSK